MPIIDLTQPFSSATPVYPGDPAVRLIKLASLERDGQTNFEFTAGMHVGTHVDGPWHMVPGGKRLIDFPPEKFFSRAVMLDARGKQTIDTDVLAGKSLERGQSVLICTGWAARYGESVYYTSYPALTEAFAVELVRRGVSLVGLDAPSPDHPPFPVHKLLLKNEVLIIENLVNLTALLGATSCDLVVAPLKIEADSAPARVLARVT